MGGKGIQIAMIRILAMRSYGVERVGKLRQHVGGERGKGGNGVIADMAVTEISR